MGAAQCQPTRVTGGAERRPASGSCEYLLAHPTVLLEVSEQLDAQKQRTVTQQVQTALTSQPTLQTALLHDAASPVVATFIEDNPDMCAWCSRRSLFLAVAGRCRCRRRGPD
ncbi:hypothetical protein [Sodalis glossinidius]|uniref:hypothetical protein n=1 Tax=Sodalis glossinidius TaxID=63612 RepID=UPI0005A453A2|nr:hypothetical protein [Sodalis glossinidius]